MIDSLINTIEESVVLNEKDILLCEGYFEPILYPKNRIIEEEGQIPKYLYFVVSGFIRLFSYNKDGNEVTSHINCPPGFITSYRHFSDQTPAGENLECISECHLLRISKKDLDYIINNSPALKDFSIWVFQQSILYNENRAKALATLTAEDRYLHFIKSHPDVLHNVPLQYIASFLGMNPKSLSRIRKKITGR
ncbi:Crp/Fnr family transcriptional regulator [Flavobacterium sp.]|uniref:Crp/Fnr family transcriptional regulator n=1 Tax=Flavobacterium sp. TaxID=239 RepID=UPI0026100C70|nr:Crp/Fnr family transcriptional regulator [Flavobacterium sp.]